MVNVIVVLSGDGRPIQCPTIRGVREGKDPCKKGAQVCCLSCTSAEYFTRTKNLSCNSNGFFTTPDAVCKSCLHYKPEYLKSMKSWD